MADDPKKEKQLKDMEEAQLLAVLGEKPEDLPELKKRIKEILDAPPAPTTSK